MLSSNNEIAVGENLGLIPFTVATLCIPVFDTLRVMSTRIIQGNSPFKPDKTHLHHLFIKLGYSHIGTTLSIIFMNLLVVLCWYCAYKFGLSINMQLYIVIALGVLFTFILYPIVDSQTGKIRRYHAFYDASALLAIRAAVNSGFRCRKSWIYLS